MDVLPKLFDSPQLNAFVWFVGVIVGLAAFLNAVRNIHEFGKVARAKPEQAGHDSLIRQFEAIKSEVLAVGVANNYPVVLHKLRRFFIENGFVANPAIEPFFQAWLSDSIVEDGRPALVPGRYSGENLSRLEKELRELRL